MSFRSELPRTLRWCALGLIFSAAGLAIFGAFLGAERANEVCTSRPLVVFWGVFAVTLASGFFVFARMRRDVGLAALHLGFLAVMIGFVMDSEAVHRWASRSADPPPIRRGFVPIRVGAATAIVWDEDLRRELGRLPFRIRLDAFEIEHYPPSDEPPPLFFGVPFGPHGEWRAQLVKYRPGRFTAIPGTPLRISVLEYNTASAAEALSVRVVIEAGAERREATLTCAPDARLATLPLRPMFPGVPQLDPDVNLVLAWPTPAVRLYRSRVTILDGGRERAAEIRVNHPLRVGDYHLYQHSWGDQPERHSILLVVHARGLRTVYAGMFLLCAGPLWLYWRPRRRASS